MMQVLANLISNACKYSSEGTAVTIKAESIGEMAIVYVQNFGPGVPENFKNRIFQAFSQADGSDTRAKGGTGLGLNITRQNRMASGREYRVRKQAERDDYLLVHVPVEQWSCRRAGAGSPAAARGRSRHGAQPEGVAP